jgi:hypothetical protein
VQSSTLTYPTRSWLSGSVSSRSHVVATCAEEPLRERRLLPAFPIGTPECFRARCRRSERDDRRQPLRNGRRHGQEAFHKAVGQAGRYGFDSSTSAYLHWISGADCAHHGAQGCISEGYRVRHPDDSVLHQSSRTWPFADAPAGARARETDPAAPRRCAWEGAYTGAGRQVAKTIRLSLQVVVVALSGESRRADQSFVAAHNRPPAP